MAENESIGGVSISITGDFSSLQSDFAQAQAAAKDAGDKIAAAMTSGMMATADFDAELKKLVDDGKSINEAMVIMAARFTDAGTAAKQAGGGVLDLDGSIKELANDTKQLAPAVTQVNTAFSQMGSQLMTLGAYYLSARFLKTLATDALESYGALQNATIALTYLTGSAATADGVLAGLRDLAISDALSFPSLVTAEQRMLEFGVSAGTLPTLLGSIADAAAITNRSFDAVANSMERMIESGMVQARSLVQVGLSLEDLGKVMGIASEDVKAAFADLDPTQRAQVFADAMAKMNGVAQESAQTVTGQWKVLAAEWESAMQKMGGALGPIGSAILNWAIDTVHAIGEVASQMSALAEFFTRNYNASMGIGIGGSGEVVNQNNQSLQGTGSLAGRPGDFGGESNLPTSTDTISSGIKAIVALNQAMRDSADAAKVMQTAYEQFDTSARAMFDRLPVTYGEYLGKLSEGGQTAAASLKAVTAEIDKATEVAQGMTGARLADMNQWISALGVVQDKMKAFADSDAFTIAAVKIQALTDKFPDQVKELQAALPEFQQFFDTMAAGAANVPDALNKVDVSALTGKLLEAQKQLDDSGQKLETTFTKAFDQYEVGARKAAGITTDLKAALDDLEPQWQKVWDQFPVGIQAAWTATQTLRDGLKGLGIAADESGQEMPKSLTKFNEVANSSVATLTELQLSWGKVSGTISKLATADLPLAISEYQKMIDAATRLGAPIGDQLILQQKLTADEIAYATRYGVDATDLIIKLDGITRAQQALTDQSQLLGKTYVGLMGDFQGAFGALGKGIADNIVDGKNWGDVFLGIIDNLAKAILNTLIGSAFKQLGDELLRQGGLLSNFSKGLVDVIGKLGVGGGSAAATAAGAYNYGGETVTSGAAEATSAATTAGGASSSGIGGLLGGGGLLGLAGLGVSIASGIVNGLQNARLINLTGEIEVSTRAAKEQLIANELTMDQYLPQLGHLVDIWSTLETIQSLINQWMHNPGNAAYVPIQQSVDTPVTSRDPNSLQTNYLRPGGRTAGGLLPSTQFPTSLNALSSGWAPELLQPLGDVNANNPLAPGKGGPGSLPPSWTAPIAPGNPLVAAYPSDPGGAVMSQLAVMLARQAQMPTATLPSYPESAGATFLPNTLPKSGSLGAYDVTGGRAAVTVNALNPSARSVAQAIIQALNERGMRTT